MSFIKVQGKQINITPNVYILERLVNIYIKVKLVSVIIIMVSSAKRTIVISLFNILGKSFI
jgi:hypothetical protein